MNDFLAKIKNSHHILSEVDTFSVEERMQNYETHKSTDGDILIYEQIAMAYQRFSLLHPTLSIDQKKEVFNLLLKMTMGMEYNGIYLNEKEQSELQVIFGDTVLKVIQSF